nr:amino acid permease [Mesomycoplasma hyorhinis]
MTLKNARKLGFFAALAMLVGSVVGVGIFFKNNSIQKVTDSQGITWLLAWVVGGVISLIVALNFSEISFLKPSKLIVFPQVMVPVVGCSFKAIISSNFDYFPSNNASFFVANINLLEWLSQWPLNNTLEENKDNSDHRIRSFLGRMLFNGDQVFKNVQVTSGGEKVRLMFSKMMLTESNFLIFDQPLDHLDSESIDSVIEGLQSYNSGLIFTTYNRAMIKKVANVILDIRSDASYIFKGTLEEYEQKMGY